MHTISILNFQKVITLLGMYLLIIMGSFLFTPKAHAESHAVIMQQTLPVLTEGVQFASKVVREKIDAEGELLANVSTANDAQIAMLMQLLEQLMAMYQSILAGQQVEIQEIPGDTNPYYNTQKGMAENEIEEAEYFLDKAKDAYDEVRMSDGEDVQIENLINDARNIIIKAKNLFAKTDYTRATSYAQEAKDFAEKALDLAEGNGSTTGVTQKVTIDQDSLKATVGTEHLIRGSATPKYGAVFVSFSNGSAGSATVLSDGTWSLYLPTEFPAGTYKISIASYMNDTVGRTELASGVLVVSSSVVPRISATPSSGVLSLSGSPTLWVTTNVSGYTPEGPEIVDFGDGSKYGLGYTTNTNNKHDYHTPGTYKIRLMNGSKVVATTQVVVKGSASASPTMTLTASPSTISAGDSVKISWSSKNANYCAMGDKYEKSGTEIIDHIETTKTYKMTCVGDSGSVTKSVTVSVEEAQDDAAIWSYPQSPADILVVGVYEGGYPNGDSHSYRYHPEGEVTVNVSNLNSDNTILILNAYEPVHWKITGEYADRIKGVLMTGYHDQRISGLDSGIEVLENTYENGSDEYFIVYNGQNVEDDEFGKLVDYVEGKTDLTPYLFFGGYSEDSVYVGVKG